MPLPLADGAPRKEPPRPPAPGFEPSSRNPARAPDGGARLRLVQLSVLMTFPIPRGQRACAEVGELATGSSHGGGEGRRACLGCGTALEWSRGSERLACCSETDSLQRGRRSAKLRRTGSSRSSARGATPVAADKTMCRKLRFPQRPPGKARRLATFVPAATQIRVGHRRATRGGRPTKGRIGPASHRSFVGAQQFAESARQGAPGDGGRE